MYGYKDDTKILKLQLQFGIPGGRKKNIEWKKELKEFPKIVKFEGKRWEWIMYDKSKTGNDYDLAFGRISDETDLGGLPVPCIEEMFPDGWAAKCECGAIYTSFPEEHMFFCPKWRKP